MPPSSSKNGIPIATKTSVSTRLAVGVAIGFIAGIIGASYGFVIFTPNKSKAPIIQKLQPPETAINCPVGATASKTKNGVCICPDGTIAPNSGCLALDNTCPKGATALTTKECVCPNGSIASKLGCLTLSNTCPKNSEMSVTGECLCFDGTSVIPNGCPIKPLTCGGTCNALYFKCTNSQSPSCLANLNACVKKCAI